MTIILGPITGDSDADKFIKEKVYEDYSKPPTKFNRTLKDDVAEPVLGFTGGYRFLSNFYHSPVHALGRVFPTVEHAYQAAKRPTDFELHEKLLYMSPGETKSVMRQVPITAENWDATKVSAMKMLVEQKFFSHEDLMWMLLGTRQRHLEEVNSWGDKFWGTDGEDKLHPLVADITGTVYNGENNLGKVLMEVRHLIRLSIAGQTRQFERVETGDSFYYDVK